MFAPCIPLEADMPQSLPWTLPFCIWMAVSRARTSHSGNKRIMNQEENNKAVRGRLVSECLFNHHHRGLQGEIPEVGTLTICQSVFYQLKSKEKYCLFKHVHALVCLHVTFLLHHCLRLLCKEMCETSVLSPRSLSCLAYFNLSDLKSGGHFLKPCLFCSCIQMP